jgi:hypothetical protein
VPNVVAVWLRKFCSRRFVCCTHMFYIHISTHTRAHTCARTQHSLSLCHSLTRARTHPLRDDDAEARPRVKSVAELGEAKSVRVRAPARPSPAIIAWDDEPLPGESYTEVVANGLGMVQPMRGKQVAQVTRERTGFSSLLSWPAGPLCKGEAPPPPPRAPGHVNPSLTSPAMSEAFAELRPPISFSAGESVPHRVLHLREPPPPPPAAAAGRGRARDTQRRGKAGAPAVSGGGAGITTVRQLSVGELMRSS